MRKQKAWRPSEIRKLKELYNLGVGPKFIALQMDRTYWSVTSRLKILIAEGEINAHRQC